MLTTAKQNKIRLLADKAKQLTVNELEKLVIKYTPEEQIEFYTLILEHTKLKLDSY